MHISMTKCALAGCTTFLVAGCASQQSIAPQYRLSAPSAQVAEGSSMLQRGRAQLDAGLDALAIESFRTEIRFDPDNVDAYNGLGVAYGRIGRNDLAQRYFEIALAKDPMNVKVQANLAKLPGNEAIELRQASALPPPEPVEPVAITADAAILTEERSVASIELPALAELPVPIAQLEAAPSVEILSKRGVLSARFAVASAGMMMAHVDSIAVQANAPARPAQPPATPKERPAPLIQPENRVGTRLERISLNEVRLITRSMSAPLRPEPTRSFDNFGARLALWLPAYMSVEQAASRYRGDEKYVVMAAAERPDTRAKVTTATKAPDAEQPEFAYIFLDDSNGVIGT